MEHFTVEQVAARLGLHVKTVRNYVRDGRLPAVRVGKRYRIAKEDLEAFTGLPLGAPAPARRAEVSSIVQIDGIARSDMDRVSTMVLGALSGGPRGLRAEFVHDEERSHLKIIILGRLEETAQVLRIVDALVRD
ncbi:helix-turn-helix domain-containing protein [Nonomuraea sp. KC401]|uniref:helix-turn-helix domain-containing protein n=1 Tax=unclassified Nonomuraea TaxID=2593643 RepID=UPI0010FE68BD|nr:MULTISPECIES: helix-turn-helix domain-containing protein [unclassified Nonomuraea]NBE96737.1 helix-turn-helix domain-containing protein [Nonomuraea sp. K271]TLF78985.1 helix-turn-helix domain-containing protein [Nonomuraea sp. KC401]